MKLDEINKEVSIEREDNQELSNKTYNIKM